MALEIRVPDGSKGDYAVETFTISETESRISTWSLMKNGRGYAPPGNYKKLTYRKRLWMTNTPDELRDHREFINIAKNYGGHILINGLGLGLCLEAILVSDKIETVTVVEISQDVIDLVGPTYTADKRVTVVCADAYTYSPPKGVKYSAVWHDIWMDINADNIEGMKKLHRKYGKRSEWQGSWCRPECEYARRR